MLHILTHCRFHSKTIRDMDPLIDPSDDYMTIAAAEERMDATQAARKKELEEAHAKLRGMQGILITLFLFSSYF